MRDLGCGEMKESTFQINLVHALRKVLPPDCAMSAFPAGGGGPVRGAMLKRMGLESGWPDIILVYRGCAYGMELKTKKGRVSEAQLQTHERLAVAGMDVRVVRSIDEAFEALAEFRIPLRIVGEWKPRRAA